MKNKNGVTLIALVVTIIILLILTGVAIMALSGENGLINKITIAKNRQSENEAEEKLKLKIMEFKSGNIEDVSLEKFKEFLEDGNEYVIEAVYVNSDENEEIKKLNVTDLESGYTFEIDKDFNITGPIKNTLKTEATYEIISSEGTKNNIIIYIHNDLGIESVIYPSGKRIEGNNKTNISIDYETETNNQYQFIIQTQNGEETFILDTNTTDDIVITETSGYAYPIISIYGTEIGKFINIEYPEEGEKYYSTDDGSTWKKYTSNIIIKNPGSIKAKNIIDNKITQIVSKDITLQLASDALNSKAYDNDMNTYDYFISGTTRRVNIDSSMWGKSIGLYGTSNDGGPWYRNYITCYDENDEILVRYNVGPYTWNNEKYDIPENTTYLTLRPEKFDSRFNMYIREIGPYTMPEISSQSVYAKICENGVIPGYSIITVDYLPSIIKKLYKVDEEEWKEYTESIELEIGKTIYCKGIDKDGVESPISQLTVNAISDELRPETYDNNTDTYDYFISGTTRRIDIDPSMWGESITLYGTSNDGGPWYRNYITCYDENDEILVRYNVGPYTWDNEKYDIPENTTYLTLRPEEFDSRFNMYIREIGPYTTPKISSQSVYAKICENGVIPGYSIITVDYLPSIIKKLYKVDEEEWKEYTESIELEIGKTIYCKGIDKDGVESPISQLTVNAISDELRPETYDNNTDTYDYFSNGAYRIINIDKSIWGKTVSLTLHSANAGSGYVNKVEMKDESGTVLNSFNVAYAYDWNEYQFEVPENTKYLQFTANSFDGRFSFSIYEVGPGLEN